MSCKNNKISKNDEEWREILRKEEEELKKEIWKKGGIGMLSFTLFPWLWF